MELEVTADAIIALSYFIIPIEILWITMHLKQVYPKIENTPIVYWIIIGFELFILSCGATHVIGALNFTEGAPIRIILKWITAIVSILTAVIMLLTISPILYTIQKMNNMEDEIEQKTWQLTEEVKKFNLYKTNFLGILSHEIRTPFIKPY